MREEPNKENVIEFLSGEHYCVCTFTNRTHIRRIKEIYAERKDDFKYLYVNEDGSVCAKIPLKWIRINPTRVTKREISEEQKEKLRLQLENARKKRKAGK